MVESGLEFSKGEDFLEEEPTTTARSIERWLTHSNDNMHWLVTSAPANLSRQGAACAVNVIEGFADDVNKQNRVFTAAKVLGNVAIPIPKKRDHKIWELEKIEWKSMR
jgi:hypothetical protein